MQESEKTTFGGYCNWNLNIPIKIFTCSQCYNAEEYITWTCNF